MSLCISSRNSNQVETTNHTAGMSIARYSKGTSPSSSAHNLDRILIIFRVLFSLNDTHISSNSFWLWFSAIVLSRAVGWCDYIVIRVLQLLLQSLALPRPAYHCSNIKNPQNRKYQFCKIIFSLLCYWIWTSYLTFPMNMKQRFVKGIQSHWKDETIVAVERRELSS